MFSKACEYGIRAVLYISACSLQDNRVTLADIAREINSPLAFTAKILQRLAKNNLVDSVKGPHGGFRLENVAMQKLTLKDIVLAIDGDKIFNSCALGLSACGDHEPCPLHSKYGPIRMEISNMLENTSLLELSRDIDGGLTFLKK